MKEMSNGDDRMAVTIKDIVEISGYSRGTIDRALNNKPRISEKTKAEIKKIASELGYRPDFVARSLVKGVTMTIGVVVFDIRNRYFALLLNAIEKAAKAENYSVIIMLQEKDKALELKVLNDLVDRHVDGIILCPVNKGDAFTELIKGLPMPVVTIGNFVSEDIHNIGIDEKKAAFEGTELIVAKGYGKIIFVCPFMEDAEEENIFVHEQRVEGFVESSKRHDQIIFEVINNRKSLDNIGSYIDSKYRTALFCSGDMLALDIIKILRKSHIHAPTDFGVMGFDGLDILDYITPPLTTIHNPVEDIGEEAFIDLQKLIKGEHKGHDKKVPYYIVEGETI